MLDTNVQKSSKVPKLMLKQYLHQAKDAGLINMLDADGHRWQFPEPWQPVAADGSDRENTYQILLHAFGLRPFDLDKAITAFKDGTPERVLPLIKGLQKEGIARLLDDIGLWILEK